MIERGCRHTFFGFPSELHTARAYYLHTYRRYRVYESVLRELFSALKIAHARAELRGRRVEILKPTTLVLKMQKLPVRIFAIII